MRDDDGIVAVPGASALRRSVVPAILAGLTALAVLGPLPSQHASGATSFTFYGAGSGHGLGLSQWGAYGLAKRGWSYQKILGHFYRHTKVQREPGPRKLRVGLTQGQNVIHLEARGGPVLLRTGSMGGTLVGKVPSGDRWTVRAAGNSYRVLNQHGGLVGGREWGGPNTNLYAVYAKQGSRAHSPEGGNTYNRGFLELNLYSCGGGCTMRMILDIAFEQYLLGVAEVPNSWPMDALKAQAVAARSYAAFKVQRYGQHSGGCNCGLVANTLDQAYAGYDKEHSLLGERWVRAVRDTAGRVSTYSGDVIQAFYSASSGGYTENNENVWGGSPIPYLRGVCDPGDYVRANPNRSWRLSRTSAEVTSALRPYTTDIGTVRRFDDFERGVSGRIITVRVVGATGGHVIRGTELRSGLGLRDDRVWINDNRLVTGAIRATYDRLGCAPGLATSRQSSVPGGERQSFRTGAIFHSSSGDVTVWLKGAILGEYRAHGGPRGILGMPASQVQKLTRPDGCHSQACSTVRLRNGRVYYKTHPGAHALWGKVLAAYLRHHGAAGRLGFPTTAVRSRAGGGTEARFEHGTIVCRSSGCRIV